MAITAAAVVAAATAAATAVGTAATAVGTAAAAGATALGASAGVAGAVGTAGTLAGYGAIGAGLGAATSAATGGDIGKGALFGGISGAAGGALGAAAGAAGGTGGSAAGSAAGGAGEAGLAGGASTIEGTSTGAMGSMTGFTGPGAATPSMAQSAANIAKPFVSTALKPLMGSGAQGAHYGAELGSISGGGSPTQGLATMATGSHFVPAESAMTAGQGGQYLQQAYNLANSKPVQMATGLLQNKQSGPTAPIRPTGGSIPPARTETNLGRRKYAINSQGYLVRN